MAVLSSPRMNKGRLLCLDTENKTMVSFSVYGHGIALYSVSAYVIAISESGVRFCSSHRRFDIR